MRCKICGSSTSAKIIIKEPRYFHGEGNICQKCFDYWVSDNFFILDELAIDKLKRLMK